MNKNAFAEAFAEAITELAELDRRLAEMESLTVRRAQVKTWIQLTQQIHPELVADPQQKLLIIDPPAPIPMREGFVPFALGGGMRPRRADTQKDRIAAAAADILRAEGPMLSRALLERLTARGVAITGSDPVTVVSSILSRDPMFESNRSKGGWLLVPPHKEETPPGEPTPAGS